MPANSFTMKSGGVLVALILIISSGDGLRSTPDVLSDSSGSVLLKGRSNMHLISKKDISTETIATGSSLPDCSHACGPCFPCRRVMVSFTCSIAESCPIVYRCMCKGRYYHVPSS